MSYFDRNIITTTQVRTLTGKAQGVEDRKLDASIHDAQDALEQILGSTLYAQVEGFYPTFAGDYSTLYSQYIQPFLAFKTVELSYQNLFAEPDRNGVFKKSGEGYTPVSLKELAMLQADPAGRADRFQRKMLRWIGNLDSSNAIKVAFNTDVDDEPRTKKTYRGRVITRRSRWQFEGGNRYPYGYRDENHCTDEC